MALSVTFLGELQSILVALQARLAGKPGGAGGASAQAPLAVSPLPAPAAAASRPLGDRRVAPSASGVASSLDLPPSPGASIPSPGGAEPVLLLGNKKRPRTIASFLKVMQRRGLPLPFDPQTLDPRVLDTLVPKGHTVALTPAGRIVGMATTESVMADENLGLQNHLKHGVETHTRGGDVMIGGQSHDVSQSFLKSPIMLDLNGDGKLGTTGVSTAKQRIDAQVGRTVDFDIDGDGDDDQIEWMDGQGDGMLVDDRDGGATAAMRGDGKIDGTRLFGDQGGQYANGYDKLAKLDRDGDGTLVGDELAGLKTWVDDGDAKVEAGELKSLAELGVTQISARMRTEKNARGEDLMRSTFVRNGQTQVTEDVWFRNA